jgi:hypothetical protein
METIVCQAVEINNVVDVAQVSEESISTLSSLEMSFVGGGCLAVQFA